MITQDHRQVILQFTVPVDIKMNLSLKQNLQIPKHAYIYGEDTDDYSIQWPKPYTMKYTDVDILLDKIITPNHNIIIDKIKIGLHQPAKIGCFKLNLWDMTDPENIVNLLGCKPEVENMNLPFTVESGHKLIKNALESNKTVLSPLEYTLVPNSRLRLGLQSAESDAYGLKVFIIGWSTIQEKE